MISRKTFRRSLQSLACAALFAAPRFSQADVITIHPSQDVTLFGNTSTNNNTSSGPGMFVGSDSNTLPKRGIMEFNIAGSVPAGSVVTSVTLTLYLGMVAGSDTMPRSIGLHDVTTAWTPSTLGTTGFPATTNPFGGTGAGFAHTGGDQGASWNFATFNSTPWTTPGGDFTAAASATASVTQTLNSAYSWNDPLMATDVQKWLDGTMPNDGWLLESASEASSQSFRAFYTLEGANEKGLNSGSTDYRPTLTITILPEPASLALFAFAAPAMLLRRRKRIAA